MECGKKSSHTVGKTNKKRDNGFWVDGRRELWLLRTNDNNDNV